MPISLGTKSVLKRGRGHGIDDTLAAFGWRARAVAALYARVVGCDDEA